MRVRTLPVEDPGPLTHRLPDGPAVAWLRGGDGLVGWGELARFEVGGPGRMAAAREWWDRLCDTLAVEDEVGLPGSGPLAFGSFGFANTPGRSVLVVPRVVLGRRDGRAWLTTYGADARALPAPARPRAPGRVRWAEGALPVLDWQAAVGEAVRRISAGEVRKVVLARDLVAHLDEPVDARALLDRLAAAYPQCWVFGCDGLVGATPELLVRRHKTAVGSRVLAGTVRRDAESVADRVLAAGLLASPKELEEHAYAVRSVADVLRAHCSELDAPAAPYLLRLANVQHLASDITGRLVDDTSVLELAAALHPTAAVCGTPTDRAAALIAELEGMDRGRYAGPVGWLDATGDGEWCIALRCAEVDGTRVRLFAGCGIVAGSDPQAELAESQAKLVAMRDALEG